jgi:hypothetical protein
LASACGTWHAVLGRTYLPQSASKDTWEREGAARDDELRREGLSPYDFASLPEPWRSRMQESWRRIFDVEDLRGTNTIQACFERLNLDDVFEVARFSAAIRGRRA